MMIHVVVIIMIYREWRRAIAETSCFNTATVYFKTITYGGFNIVFGKLCIEPRQIFKYTIIHGTCHGNGTMDVILFFCDIHFRCQVK